MECCSPRGKGAVESFYVMVRWVACLVCVLSLRVLYMYCRAPCRALSMNLGTSFLGIRKTAYTYCTLVTYTNRACSFHTNKLPIRCFGKPICYLSVGLYVWKTILPRLKSNIPGSFCKLNRRYNLCQRKLCIFG